jgi:cob(I)alamin adenosyltransferase
VAIYTKRGDKGETSLYDPESRQNIRVSKDSLKVGAIGAIDELNSYLGTIDYDLREIQRNLFTIGSILAGAKLRFNRTKTKKLEKAIDKLEGELPVLKNFIIYGGTEIAARLYYARAICRRAERELVSLSKLSAVPSTLPSYMNRLSDYLFMLARKVNFDAKVKEEIWKRK